MKDKKLKIAGPEENWTRLPNWIGDNLALIHPIETHILVFVTRQNHGWKDDPNTRFSARYVSKGTGLSLPTSHKYIEILREKGYILRIKEGNSVDPAEYKINWGAIVSVKGDLTGAFNGVERERLTALNNLKETISKKQPKESGADAPVLFGDPAPRPVDPSPPLQNGEHQQLIDEWYERFKEIYNKKPDQDCYGREGKTLKKLRKEFSKDEIMSMLDDLYWRCKMPINGDRFLSGRGFYLSTILSNWHILSREGGMSPEELEKREIHHGVNQ